MTARLSRWGIGPRIAVGAAAYAIAVVIGQRFWPTAWPTLSLPRTPLLVAGVALIALGVPLWLSGVAAAMRAYNSDALVTSGVFGLVRHPVYAAWIVLIIPGIALVCQAWPLLGAAVVGYVIFKAGIHREDDYLRARFGQAYHDYRLRVNEIIPFPKFWQSKSNPDKPS